MIMKKSLLLSSIVLSSVIAGAQAMDASQEVNGTGTNQIEASQSANTVISKLKVQAQVRSSKAIEAEIKGLSELYSAENDQKKQRDIRQQLKLLNQELNNVITRELQVKNYELEVRNIIDVKKEVVELYNKGKIPNEEKCKVLKKLDAKLKDMFGLSEPDDSTNKGDKNKKGIENPRTRAKAMALIINGTKAGAGIAVNVTRAVVLKASTMIRTYGPKVGNGIKVGTIKVTNIVRTYAPRVGNGIKDNATKVGRTLKPYIQRAGATIKGWATLAWNKISSHN